MISSLRYYSLLRGFDRLAGSVPHTCIRASSVVSALNLTEQWQNCSAAVFGGPATSPARLAIWSSRGRHPVVGRSLATEAEFSGGAFTATGSSASDSKAQPGHNEDLDSTELILETALQFVVGPPLLLACESRLRQRSHATCCV